MKKLLSVLAILAVLMTSVIPAYAASRPRNRLRPMLMVL